MKYTIVAAFSLLSTLASGLALPDLTPREAQTFHPNIGIVIKQDSPTQAFPPSNIVEVSRSNSAHDVKALLGFNLPAFPAGKSCTVSFSNALTATGSRRLGLFTTIGYPAAGNTWNSKPPTNIPKGTFIANVGRPAEVVDNTGLTFDCPTTPTNYGYEVQPVWDNDSVTWDITNGGFVITSN